MAQRPDSLVIFASSLDPDPYVNILVQASKTNPLKRITFISIIDDNPDTDDNPRGVYKRAESIRSTAFKALESLAAGQYQKGDRIEKISDGMEVYRDCLERLKWAKVSSQSVRWGDLTDVLRHGSKSDNALFDVTTLKKRLLIDVFALLLSQGDSQMWMFELTDRKQPTHGQADLIHALKEKEYVYHCITEGKHVETARSRMLARSLTYRSLIVLTVAILIPVVLVEIFLPQTWLQSAIVGLGTAIGISGWFLAIKRT